MYHFDHHTPDNHQAVIDAPWLTATLGSDYVNRRLALARASSAAPTLTLNASLAAHLGRNLEAFISSDALKPDHTFDTAYDIGFARAILCGVSLAIKAGATSPPVEWVHPWIARSIADRNDLSAPVLPLLAIADYPVERRLGWLLDCLSRPVIEYFHPNDDDLKAILEVPVLAKTLVLHRLINSLHGKTPLSSNVASLYGQSPPEITSCEVIGKYAPDIGPHWPAIVALGLTFPEAHALVFGSADICAELPLEITQPG